MFELFFIVFFFKANKREWYDNFMLYFSIEFYQQFLKFILLDFCRILSPALWLWTLHRFCLSKIIYFINTLVHGYHLFSFFFGIFSTSTQIGQYFCLFKWLQSFFSHIAAYFIITFFYFLCPLPCYWTYHIFMDVCVRVHVCVFIWLAGLSQPLLHSFSQIHTDTHTHTLSHDSCHFNTKARHACWMTSLQ